MDVSELCLDDVNHADLQFEALTHFGHRYSAISKEILTALLTTAVSLQSMDLFSTSLEVEDWTSSDIAPLRDTFLKLTQLKLKTSNMDMSILAPFLGPELRVLDLAGNHTLDNRSRVSFSDLGRNMPRLEVFAFPNGSFSLAILKEFHCLKSLDLSRSRISDWANASAVASHLKALDTIVFGMGIGGNPDALETLLQETKNLQSSGIDIRYSANAKVDGAYRTTAKPQTAASLKETRLSSP